MGVHSTKLPWNFQKRQGHRSQENTEEMFPVEEGSNNYMDFVILIGLSGCKGCFRETEEIWMGSVD